MRITVLAFIIFITGTFAKGQSTGIDLGLTGGFNISTHTDKYNYSGGVAFTPNIAAGYQAGLLVRGRFSESWGLQLEPSIIKLGARYRESFMQQEQRYYTDSWTRLVYFQLPLAAQYSIKPLVETMVGSARASTRYHLTGGLFGGYLINAQFKGMNYVNITGESLSKNKFSEDVTESYSRYDAGFVFGIGVEYDRTIGLDVELQHTLYKTYKYEGLEIREKNMALMFSVTYLIIN